MERRAVTPPQEDQPAPANPWQPWFIASIIALGAAVLVFFFVVFSLARDDDAGDLAANPGTPTDVAGGDPTDDDPDDPTGTSTSGSSATPSQSATQQATPTRPAGEQLRCGDIMVPLNKVNFLPNDCEPGDLEPIPTALSQQGVQYMRAEARAAFIQLVNSAAVDGFNLYAISAYRSYEGQVAAYNSNLAACGGDVACADRISAHPGHSEHQLGTTVDVSSASAGFGLESFVGTPEADWVEENAWRHGFVVSYPEGKEAVTGYSYEPWHIRFIGKDEAQRVNQSGLTLHEYLAQD